MLLTSLEIKMITLILKNFRCWESHTFTFNKNGIILISGVSGKGKSTILNALLYVITGNMKNVTMFGKEKHMSEVILKIDDFIITRGKNPTRFNVKRNSDIYESDQAQSIIDEYFGIDFKHISYIDQDNQFSFVYLTPENKMSFLRNLLLSSDSIEKIKEDVKKKMDTSKKEAIIEDSNINITTSFLSTLKYTENINKISKRLITSDNYKETFDLQQNNLEKSKKNKLILQTKIRKLEENRKKYLESSKVTDKIKELENQLSLFDLPSDLSELSKEKEYAIKKKKYSEDIDLLEKYNEQLKTKDHFSIELYMEKLNKIVPVHRKLVELDDKIGDKDIDELNSLKTSLINDIKNIHLYMEQQNVYKCPSCKSSLKLKNGILENFNNEYTYTPVEDGSLHKKQKQLDSVQKDLILLERYKDEYNKQFDLLEELLKDSIFSMETDFDDLFNKYKIEERQCSTLKSNINDLEKRIKGHEYKENSRDVYIIMEEIARHNESIKRMNEINQQLKNLQSQQVSIDIDPIHEIEETKNKLDEYEEKIETYIKSIEQLKKWKDNEKYTELTNQIQKSKDAKEYLIEEVKSCEKLLYYIKEAETRSIFDFIDSLNSHASIYIEDFFPDEDISVSLVTNKELKSGKDKVGLFFEVNYKTMKGDIDFLSGGQKDRVNLAFTLAFSELVQNRILLLDECISSLDSETSDTVIETLKDKYKGKLILCVAHQVNTGTFDQVVNV